MKPTFASTLLARAACLLPFAATGFAQDAAEPPPLKDKTFVVWAAPANLTQKGGSILTLDDRADHFDGVVFGELGPGKWMAGSDGFSRTQKDQAAFPAETVGPETFVQIAISYKGREVTVYRNGQQYSKHTMPGAPLELPAWSVAMIGKRHERQQDKAHFAGAIDDARIYDRALSRVEIAALKPNTEGGPKPWAWWTFDDQEGKDRTGRYKAATLTGGAEIKNGKLVLDGKTGEFSAKSGAEYVFKFETPARPKDVPANWLTYHLAHPGPGTAMPGDPNCAFFWKGQYHLHYIYTHRDGFAFAHLVSTDLIHWQWHKTVLTPSVVHHGMFSGTGFFTKDGKPAIIYHGQGSGRNQIQVAEDDNLDKWSEPWPLEPKILPGQDASKIAHWDPDAWVDGDNYYAISGGSPGSGKPPTLFRSKDLKAWDYLNLFLDHDMPDVQANEDISCPNFYRIGNKWMLLCISHNKGCRYYLGDWKNEKFVPEFHARMNWFGLDCFAPESVLTPDGRRVMWAWCHLGAGHKGILGGVQSGIQTLPRELSLPEDGVLRIKPLRELQTLRTEPKQETNVAVTAAAPYQLKEIGGETIELNLTINPGNATEYGLRIGTEGKDAILVTLRPGAKQLVVGPTTAPFELKAGEKLQLTVFLDKQMIEVFANDRQAVVTSFSYTAENPITLFTKDANVAVPEVKAWKMKSIYPE